MSCKAMFIYGGPEFLDFNAVNMYNKAPKDFIFLHTKDFILAFTCTFDPALARNLPVNLDISLHMT